MKKQAAKYDRIAEYLFRSLTEKYSDSTLPQELPFDLDHVRKVMGRAVSDGAIDKVVKNVADIKYTYDARRHLPEEIERSGNWTWLPVAKGKYKFKRTQRKNLIDLTTSLDPIPKIETIPDQTSPFIDKCLGKDEQAVFTRVRHAGLISTFLGFQASAIQGHHRTTVSHGQIEIDEVQAGIDGQRGTIIPISGKGGQDKLSWTQALNLNVYGAEKTPIPDLSVRSVGLWRDNEDTIWLVEFSPETDINKIGISQARRFRFERDRFG